MERETARSSRRAFKLARPLIRRSEVLKILRRNVASTFRGLWGKAEAKDGEKSLKSSDPFLSREAAIALKDVSFRPCVNPSFA